MATSASTPNMSAKEQYQALLAQMANIQAQAEREEHEKREEQEHTEQEEHEKIEAARVAAEREEVRKVLRAAKSGKPRRRPWRRLRWWWWMGLVRKRGRKKERGLQSPMWGPMGSQRWRQRKLPIKGEFRFD